MNDDDDDDELGDPLIPNDTRVPTSETLTHKNILVILLTLIS